MGCTQDGKADPTSRGAAGTAHAEEDIWAGTKEWSALLTLLVAVGRRPWGQHGSYAPLGPSAQAVPIEAGRVLGDDRALSRRKVLKTLCLLHGVEVEVDDDIVRVVDRSAHMVTFDAGLLPGVVETPERLLPHFEVCDGVLDVQGGHGVSSCGLGR